MFKRILFLSILIISSIGQSTSAQIGMLTLSPLQRVHQKIAKTDIELEYSRPAIRGRTIFGDLVPYNKLWRTGANKNTKFTFSKDVVLDGQAITAGSYVLFTKPSLDKWDIFIYDQVGDYGIPDDYTTDKIVAHTTVVPRSIERTVQSLTITLSDLTNDGFNVILAWENTEVTIPIALTTEDEMTKIIEDVLDGPDADDYYLAAQYTVDSGANLDKALEWINTSIELTDKVSWWEYWIKAKCHLKLSQKQEAKETANLGMSLAKESESAYGQKQIQLVLDALDK